MKINQKFLILIKNIYYAFAAQTISLLLSVLMSLIVPKMLGVTDFGYWQLFMFYASYAGFFHFGLNDGIYLRIGGEHYHNLNYSMLGSQFWAAIACQSVIAACICIYANLFESVPQRKFVLICAAIYMIFVNALNYMGYIFQATNHTKIYSLATIVNNVFFILCVFVLLILKTKHFELFVILYVIAEVFPLAYCMILGKQVIRAPFMKLKTTFHEMGLNIRIGINLMLANIASMLILGSGRFIIDHKWGINVFGRFSFSLSLTNFFLLFISQISMVLFPALRQISEKKAETYYQIARDGLGVVLSAIFLCYFPVKYILGFWLPQYAESLKYLALLLPLCTFDGKMQMLCNTYLKVLRKEKLLLRINVIAVAFSLTTSLVGAYVFQNILTVIVFIVISIALRSVISELILASFFHMSVLKNIASETALAAIFVLATWFLSPLFGFVIYAVCYLFYLFINKEKIRSFKKNIFSIIR